MQLWFTPIPRREVELISPYQDWSSIPSAHGYRMQPRHKGVWLGCCIQWSEPLWFARNSNNYNTTNQYMLKKTDIYYYQVQSQLGLTGLDWCDSFGYIHENLFFCTRIVFDSISFQEAKDKVDSFFFSSLLTLIPWLFFNTHHGQLWIPSDVCSTKDIQYQNVICPTYHNYNLLNSIQLLHRNW